MTVISFERIDRNFFAGKVVEDDPSADGDIQRFTMQAFFLIAHPPKVDTRQPAAADRETGGEQ